MNKILEMAKNYIGRKELMIAGGVIGTLGISGIAVRHNIKKAIKTKTEQDIYRFEETARVFEMI